MGRSRSGDKDPEEYGSDKVTLCVTVHPEYFHFLSDCLRKWDELLKDHDWQKILCVDSDEPLVEFEFAGDSGWSIYYHQTKHPAGGRNIGLQYAERGWIYYWDADNTPAQDLVEAIEEARIIDQKGVGILYTEIKGRPLSSSDLRVLPFIDTASLWKVDAINHVGGWNPFGVNEDWQLSVRIKAAGWRVAPLNVKIDWNDHGNNRSKHSIDNHRKTSSECRSLGIICVMRGDNDLTKDWMDRFMSMEIPSRSIGLTIVDNSGDPHFGDDLHDAGKWLSGKVDRYTVIKGSEIGSDDYQDIHHGVGFSYSTAIPATPEDLILTWEDDVMPQKSTAIKELLEIITPMSEYSVVAAVVPIKDSQEEAIGSMEKYKWFDIPKIISLGEQTPVGMVGGGFTLWTRSCLEIHPILGMTTLVDEFPLGWDGFVCRRLNQGGYRIAIAGQVRCNHG